MIRTVSFGTVLALSLAVSPVNASGPSIGVFTGIYGSVTVTAVGTAAPLPVQVADDVHFQDLIETQSASRMRALLDDDTLLSLAEDSQLEITEHLYDPEAGKRIAVLKLVRGAVRALVSKMPGTESKFEIRTDTGIAAARGTYFVVWVEPDGRMGVANIGDEGDVAFIANGLETVVKPGQYFLSVPRPTLASASSLNDPPALNRAIRSTQARDNIAVEAPKKMMHAAGGVIVPDLPKHPHRIQPIIANPLNGSANRPSDEQHDAGDSLKGLAPQMVAPNAIPALAGQPSLGGPNPAGLANGLKHLKGNGQK
jgi:FecR protein